MRTTRPLKLHVAGRRTARFAILVLAVGIMTAGSRSEGWGARPPATVRIGTVVPGAVVRLRATSTGGALTAKDATGATQRGESLDLVAPVEVTLDPQVESATFVSSAGAPDIEVELLPPATALAAQGHSIQLRASSVGYVIIVWGTGPMDSMLVRRIQAMP